MIHKRHIFLSYRSSDFDFAIKLAASLKSAGLQLWMDKFEIRTGDDWRYSIEQALSNDSCAGVITVVSPGYIDSEYCRKEMHSAVRQAIPIYPVLLHPIPLDKWPLAIEGIQYINFEQWTDENIYHEQFSKLIKDMMNKFAEQMNDKPDEEAQYLIKLIAELESRRGVLEYVEQDIKFSDIRPQPVDDEWGFALLAQNLVSRQDEKREAIPLKGIAEALSDFQRFVLVGKPGVGKTTTLRRLVLDAAKNRLNNPRTAHLPILAYLPQWNTESTPLDFVHAQCRFIDDIEKWLNMGEAHLYLDGLNEMGESGQHKVNLLRNWLNSPDSPKSIILTCRTADYKDSLYLDNFPVILTQELTEQQIQLFVEKHLKDQAGNFLHALMGDISSYESERSLFKLACNPYLLSALMVVFQNTNSLPRNTGAVFQKLSLAIWERERKRSTIGWIPFEQAVTAFSQLAFDMIDQGLPADVPLQFATEKTLSTSLFNLGISAGYITNSNESMRFCHQMFQEYFAAEAMDRKLPNNIAYLQAYITNPRWSEVLQMLAGISSNIDDILNAIVKENPILAAKCLAQRARTGNKDVSQQTKDIIIESIAHIAQPDNWLGCRHVTDIFFELGLPESIPHLEKLLLHEHPEVRWGAIHALQEIGVSRANSLLVDCLKDPFWVIRGKACVTLAKLEGLPSLKHIIPLLQDPHPYVRGRAGYAIFLLRLGEQKDFYAVYLHDQPDSVIKVFHWILSLIKATDFWDDLRAGLSSKDLQIIEAALNILAERQEVKDREQIIAALNLLLTHENNFIRAGATQAFGRLQVYEYIPRIIEIMQTDIESIVRETASVTLKMLNAKEAVPVMIKQLHTDKANGVRRRILLSLIEMRVPSASSDVLLLLEDIDNDVRGLACRYLGEFGAITMMPKIAPLQFDSEKSVREAAEGALASIASKQHSLIHDTKPRVLSHIGIIPDGNRRWAKQHEMDFEFAYWLAMKKLAMCVDTFFAHGISTISAYLLSKDNILRARNDLEAVIQAEKKLFEELLPPLITKYNLRVYHAGDAKLLPKDYWSALNTIIQTDRNINDSFPRLYLCAAYDPFDELVSAFQEKSLNSEQIINHLLVPIELDAVIRTGGDIRISGFLPLQSKYAEFFFEPYYFPDITEAHIERVISDFTIRNRRFGK